MLEKTSIRSLSKNEIDVIKILLSILEGDDTLDYISARTKLSKRRIKYLLSILEKEGFIYKKEGSKQWKVRVDYARLWKNAEYVAYKEGIFWELEEMEKKIKSRNL